MTTTEAAGRPLPWKALITINVLAASPVAADTATLELITSYDGRGDVMTVQWNPAGTLLAVASSDPVIRLRSTPDAKPAGSLRGHGSYIYDVDWSADGKLLASAACEGRDATSMHCVSGGIIVWDVENRTQLQKISFPHHVHAKSTRMQQKQGMASAIDPHSQPGAEVRATAWSKDGQFLAAGNAAGMVKIWDATTWAVIHESTPHWQTTDMAWSADGRLAVAARDNTISIWGVGEQEIVNVLDHHTLDIFSIAWHPTKPLLASASGDRTVSIWNADGKQIAKTLTGFDGSVRSVAWHPTGRYIAVTSHVLESGAAEIWIYDTNSWERVARATGEPDRLFRSLAWSPDGAMLASGGNDYRITLWRFAVDAPTQ